MRGLASHQSMDNVVPVNTQPGHTRQQLIEQNKDVFKGIGEYDKK